MFRSGQLSCSVYLSFLAWNSCLLLLKSTIQRVVKVKKRWSCAPLNQNNGLKGTKMLWEELQRWMIILCGFIITTLLFYIRDLNHLLIIAALNVNVEEQRLCEDGCPDGKYRNMFQAALLSSLCRSCRWVGGFQLRKKKSHFLRLRLACRITAAWLNSQKRGGAGGGGIKSSSLSWIWLCDFHKGRKRGTWGKDTFTAPAPALRKKTQNTPSPSQSRISITVDAAHL